MSDKKVQSEYTDVKGRDDKNIIEKDEFADSGVISEPNLSGEQYTDGMQDSGEQNVSSERTEEETKEQTARVVEEVHFDSGLDLTENFSNLSLVRELAPPTVVVVNTERETTPQSARTPLWQILFQQDEDGDNKLHLCALHGSESGVRAIISACPHRALLDMRNDDGFSPLHMAVLAAHAPVVTLLVASGANVCSRDCDGNTPLHLATQAGDVECLIALIGVRNAYNLADALEQKNYEGETCVYLAARAGNVDILRILVQFGANINSREGKAGYTALHVAAERGDRVLATFLITECTSIAPYTRNYARRTPLKLAGPKLCRALASLRREDDSSETGDDSDSDDSASDDEYANPTEYNALRSGVEAINVA